MKIQRLCQFAIALCLAQAATAFAQNTNKYVLSFQSVCQTIAADGRMVNRTLQTRDLISRCAADNQVDNTRLLTLVYSLSEDYLGDRIQVVNVTNGAVLCELYKLSFPIAITNNAGTISQRLMYVFNNQQSDPIGSALILERNAFDRDGNVIRTLLQARLQFFDPANDTSGLKLCSGNFVASRRFVPTPARR